VNFICDKCKAGAHEQCPGGTWCDCLHRQGDTSLTATTRKPTPREWGLAQAVQAPAWSDQTWRAACASLGVFQ
jgi:hypothetical protein